MASTWVETQAHLLNMQTPSDATMGISCICECAYVCVRQRELLQKCLMVAKFGCLVTLNFYLQSSIFLLTVKTYIVINDSCPRCIFFKPKSLGLCRLK